LVAQVVDTAGGYRWVYWALAGFAALMGLNALTLPGQPLPHHHTETTAVNADRRDYPIALVAALFLFFYVGAEVAFGGWVYTYAVTLKLAGAAEAAYLTSAFWLSFTIGRLLSIPVATRLRPKPILVTALGCCLAIMASLILAPGSNLVLWGVAVGLGFFMAPVWPTGYTLAGQALRLTARMSGFILLGDSFGGMVLPWLVGRVIGFVGPRALAYLVFGSLVCNALAFWGLWRLRPHAHEQSAPALPEAEIG
jgi:FHS family Na+ dependent glucose MFS transporter 1